MEGPNVPYSQVRAVIVDGRISVPMEERLVRMGMDVIKTVRHPRLYPAVSYHPDLVVCPVGRGRMVVAPEMFEYYKRALAPYRVRLIKGEKMLSGNYPMNIAYNIASTGKKAVLYSRHTDPAVMRELKGNNTELVEVKQGYAKCSTAIVSENAIITSDKGIARKSGEKGVDVLLIRSGHIRLEGLDYGFIGGCCGRISEDYILFTGNISFHPDGELIKNFLKKYNICPVGLHDHMLVDLGSIVPVVEKN